MGLGYGINRSGDSVGLMPTGDFEEVISTLIGGMTDQLVNYDWSLPKSEKSKREKIKSF